MTISVPRQVVRALLKHEGVSPCGLGARDTLRTEVGYPLNGEDLAQNKTPLECGMERFIAWDTEFPGKAAIEAQRDEGRHRVLVAIKTDSRRAPRHGMEVRAGNELVGEVTSGTFGPSVGHGVGLARLEQRFSGPGVKLSVGPKDLPAETAEIPIYKDGGCRMKFSD